MDKYKVVVSKKATSMLVSQVTFLAKASVSAAENLTEQFEKAASSLEIMPHRNPWLIADYIPRRQYRFLTLGKKHIIIYQVVDDTVYIDYVVDCRQDYQWLLK
jgi:plasmid stabilization system protein ParE